MTEPLTHLHFQQYLHRIGIDIAQEHIPATFSSLCMLQHAHMHNVPFEALDIHCNTPITLNPQFFYDKVVTRSRGGYCYELNGLFYELLTHLGFSPVMLSARVNNHVTELIGREFDHLTLMVCLDGNDWLVDVGFGDFALRPLCLNEQVQYDGRNYYRFGSKMHDGQMYSTVEKWNMEKEEFVIEILFTTTPRMLSDFEEMNHYQQKDPSSHFVQNLICTIPTGDGRISLVNNRLITTLLGEKNETEVKDEQERDEILSRHFGIKIPVATQL